MKRLSDLYQMVQSIPKQRLVVVGANDDPVIDAVLKAKELHVIDYILIGPKEDIETLLNERGVKAIEGEIIDIPDLEEASRVAVELIRLGQADILMKGLVDTKILLKAVVNKETGIRKNVVLSHVGLASYPNYDRVLYFSDGAMVIAPSVDDRLEMIKNALTLLVALGYEKPRIGLVSAVEKVNPKMQSTVDAAEIVARSHEIKGSFYIDGPFAIDNLVSIEAKVHKGIESEVAGLADLLIFPSIEAGNVFYKTSVFLAHAQTAGIILGAKAPIVLTSRADSAQAKLYSILLAAVYQYETSHSRH